MLPGDANCQRRRTVETRQKGRQRKVQRGDQRRGGESTETGQSLFIC